MTHPRGKRPLRRQAATPTLRFAIPWLLAWAATVGVAMADQNDPDLDALFERLAAAPDAHEAAVIEAEVWSRWLQSGSPEIDRQMALGMRAMESGDARSALAAFDAVIAAAPKFAEGWNKRATLYWLMGELPPSIADIDRTLELEPRHFGALSGLAMIHDSQRRPFEALEALEKVMAIHPKLPSLRARIDHLTRQLGESV